MTRIFYIGATGGVGRPAVARMIAAGHTVTALHRKPEQADALRTLGAEPVEGDLMEMSEDDFTRLTEGMDAIVFSAGAAGSGPERTTEIDGNTPGKLVRAAEANEIRRLYIVSAFPEAGRDAAPKEGFEHYMREKKRADAEVAASTLDWVILRPGTLTDTEGDGQVSLGHALTYGTVARENVAQVLAELIDVPLIQREVLEVTDGPTPVADAVAALVRGA